MEQVKPRPRTIGKTPAMAFALDYLRQFPGAGYDRMKKAAIAAGVGAPAPVLYGNALRVLKKEGAPMPAASVARSQPPGRRGRRATLRGIENLAGLVEQMQDVVADRDRLRAMVERVAEIVRPHGGRRRAPTT